MIFDPERVAEDRELSDTERTGAVFFQVANSISKNIQVTVDSPESNPDGRMPVLDLKI